MQKLRKKLPASFHETPSGKEPVRTWLKGLFPGDRKSIGLDIATIEYDWPVEYADALPIPERWASQGILHSLGI